MSETTDKQLTEAEKRKLLRERRLAKMAQGKASDRLNTILSQGSSVKSVSPPAVTSVLENKATKSTDTATVTDSSTNATSVSPSAAKATPTSTGVSSAISDFDDPEIQDISDVTMNNSGVLALGNLSGLDSNNPSQPNLDEMFQKIMQQQSQHNCDNDNSGENNPMAEMLKMFNSMGGGDNNGGLGGFDSMFSGSPNSPPPESISPEMMKYQADLAKYHTYQEQLWQFRFLVVRILATIFNFAYHFITIPSFTASNHAYVRDLSEVYPLLGFMTIFTSIEVVIIATYYLLFTKLGLFHASNQKSFILKGISTLSMFVPQLLRYEPLVATLLGYKELLGIFVGDLSLVIVMFGLLSFSN